MTTTLSTVNDRIKGVDFSNLPKRYQEAMMICKFLGIRHIWIDSLCIIQVSHSQSFPVIPSHYYVVYVIYVLCGDVGLG
jgi:hypothetical protein